MKLALTLIVHWFRWVWVSSFAPTFFSKETGLDWGWTPESTAPPSAPRLPWHTYTGYTGVASFPGILSTGISLLGRIIETWFSTQIPPGRRASSLFSTRISAQDRFYLLLLFFFFWDTNFVNKFKNIKEAVKLRDHCFFVFVLFCLSIVGTGMSMSEDNQSTFQHLAKISPHWARSITGEQSLRNNFRTFEQSRKAAPVLFIIKKQCVTLMI